jgi:hypothetical protein
VAEPDEFSLHPAIPPARVLPGQPEDKVAYVVADPWTSGPVG